MRSPTEVRSPREVRSQAEVQTEVQVLRQDREDTLSQGRDEEKEFQKQINAIMEGDQSTRRVELRKKKSLRVTMWLQVD